MALSSAEDLALSAGVDAAVGVGADAAISGAADVALDGFGATYTGLASDSLISGAADVASQGMGGMYTGLASGADSGYSLGSMASGLNSVASLAKGAVGLAGVAGAGSSTAAAASAADPFASQRGQYQAQLSALMANPNAVLPSTPGYQAGMDAVQRAGAAQGFTGSGNMQNNLLQYGNSVYQQQAQLLAMLSGATTGSPAAAGQIQQQGSVNQTNLLGQSLNSLAYGGAGLLSGNSNTSNTNTTSGGNPSYNGNANITDLGNVSLVPDSTTTNLTSGQASSDFSF